MQRAKEARLAQEAQSASEKLSNEILGSKQTIDSLNEQCAKQIEKSNALD
jgi:hypothetical protein